MYFLLNNNFCVCNDDVNKIFKVLFFDTNLDIVNVDVIEYLINLNKF